MDPKSELSKSDGAARKFFLFIGSTTVDAATSKLKAAGIYYRQKMLESTSKNWEEIVTLLEEKSLIGVVARLNGRNFELFVGEEHARVGDELLAALGKKDHLMLVHESLLTGKEESLGEKPDSGAETYVDYLLASGRFSLPPNALLDQVLAMLEENEINVVPYKTNAEMSILAAGFVDDHERHLLFRFYVPNGRLFSAELDKLLALFRKWLAETTPFRVRQDGYATPSGRVYEFFGDADLSLVQLDKEFESFSWFLDTCEHDSRRAIEWLTSKGVEGAAAESTVARYAKEARRLTLDIRHERESRLLALRQRLETEMAETHVVVGDPAKLADVVDAALPSEPTVFGAFEPGASSFPDDRKVVQQVFLGPVDTVIQDARGAAALGADAKSLLKIIETHAGAESVPLESDLFEIEDEDARTPDRLAARQRLKRFLFKVGGKVEDAAIMAAIRHLESKVGL